VDQLFGLVAQATDICGRRLVELRIPQRREQPRCRRVVDLTVRVNRYRSTRACNDLTTGIRRSRCAASVATKTAAYQAKTSNSSTSPSHSHHDV